MHPNVIVILEVSLLLMNVISGTRDVQEFLAKLMVIAIMCDPSGAIVHFFSVFSILFNAAACVYNVMRI